ncbi:Flagellar biosynthesis protein FlhA [Roseovarius sp. EC-HK134]|uniref:flagellar biosynthesis protein FlhA n=1 Tax=unclassified Roseovarius TaxID=2614913 RepID=UPI0012511139|nr:MULTISPECIES: flagellar biosynthesis protein FlhA [unclassified Roseovarius]VVT15695.1 Flagellar biosynthesis protein FlhA [Roseovarius sp. EC-HK134]VVT16297.1 Flagellar biosynthesis protein FlhA [Roseovarius sp. EC-SD190]
MGGLSIKSVFQPTVLLALALMAVIVMMILPVPAWLLDVGLAASFALAILIFTITLFIDRPLDFSAFPTILLASLMLRLALNVSSTKLIIGQGHTGTDAAGQVIEGFADFIIGGNVLLGLVVFLVLLIVNFLVITKGAARMAEVGARFALDAMPGKQLAIDSDMSAGAINHQEAKERREQEQQETTFFGSLDGASKFVKGDAVAGLLITLLNFLVGLVIGITLHDMPIGKAFETYTILTIGDGLVTQIPAVIISIAAALLLARGGNKGAADLAISEQIGRHPTALATVAVLMGLFALVPGLPFVPFLLGGVGLAALAFASHRSRGANPASSQEDSLPVSAPIRSMGDILELDDIHVEFAPDLVNMVLDPGVGLEARITNMRQYVATTYGVILSDIRLTDDPGMPPGSYVIRIQGVERARAFLRDNHLLALDPDQYPALAPGETVKEPVYGAPARWIPASEQDRAALSGATLVAPPEVLATHLLEVIRRNLSRLLTMKAMRRLLDEMVNLSDRGRSEANRKLLEDMIPDRVAPDLLHAVLRLLLAEQVSIRNLPLILESIAENRQFGPQPEAICEHVRQRLGFQLVAGLQRPDGSLPLIQLAPEWEDTFTAFEMSGERGRSDVALPPEQFSTLTAGVAEQVQLAGERGLSPALVTSSLRRRFLRTLLIARNVNVPVLSFEEIGFEAKPSLVGVVRA